MNAKGANESTTKEANIINIIGTFCWIYSIVICEKNSKGTAV